MIKFRHRSDGHRWVFAVSIPPWQDHKNEFPVDDNKHTSPGNQHVPLIHQLDAGAEAQLGVHDLSGWQIISPGASAERAIVRF